MQVTSTKKEISAMANYALLTLSIMVGFMYLNTFATEVLKIPAATLATALLVAKTADFIFSVVHGAIMEKVVLSKKLGKNQAWLYYGRWVLAICCMLEVADTTMAPMIVRVVVLAVSYTVLNCLMNILQTAYYGCLGAVAGPNPANRNAMSIAMTQRSTIITLICSFIPTLVTVLPFGTANYFVVATVFMLPMPWALGQIAKAADGKDLPVNSGTAGPQLSIKDMVGTLFQNDQLLVLFLVNTVLNIASNIYMSMYTYYFIYVVGDFTKMTVCSLIAAVVGLVAARIMPKFGVKLGKKKACMIGYLGFTAAYVAIYFLGAKSWIFYPICLAISSLGTYMYMPFGMVMFMDAGEYYLHKTGKDTRGIAMSLASPPMKIGMALGGTIGLYLLAATGYVAGFTPTPEWQSKFMFMCFLIPACIYVLCALIMAFGYKITDADAARYAQENAERMAQKQ